MNDKDPVVVDLNRYLTTLEEDYEDPFDKEQARQEWLADQEDYDSINDWSQFSMITLDSLNAYIQAKNSSTDTLLAKADGYFYFTEGEGEILIDCLTRCTYRQWCEMIDQYIQPDF